MYKKFIITATFIGILFCVGSFAARAYATDGAIDETFNSNGLGGQAAGTNASINGVNVQSSGQVIITGNFTTYDGSPAPYVARLNSNGTLDTTFNSGGAGPSSGVSGSANQADGKILIAGGFTTYDGTSAPYIARINTDGTLDTTFESNIGTGPSAQTRGIAVDPISGSNQGKILIGGGGVMNTFNGVADKNIARLNADGTPDTAFNNNVGSTGFASTIYNFGFQSTDKIIAAGGFTSAYGHAMRGIARLNSDGTYDTTFNAPGGTPGAGTNGTVYSLEVMPNDQILVGGSFTSYDGITTGHLIRLNSDGTLDTTFNSDYASSGANGEVDYIYTQPNGKIIFTGESVSQYNGTNIGYLARLNSNGSLDTTFSSGTGINSGGAPTNDGAGLSHNYFATNGTVFLPDGNTLVAGGFTSYNGNTVSDIMSVETDITNPVLTPVTIASNDTDPAYAESGNTITLSFTSNHPLTASTITIGGQSATPTCSASTGTSVNCTATITVTSLVPVSDGTVAFSLDVTTVGGETVTTSTTDGSSVTVDRTAPTGTTLSFTTPTTNTTPTISGVCTTGDTLSVTVGSQTLSATCSGSAYSVTPTALAIGSYTVGVVETDLAGNSGTQVTSPLSITSLVVNTSTMTGGGKTYVCMDPKAMNYDTYPSVGNTGCIYSSATGTVSPAVPITPASSQILGSGTCPASLTVTGNLKQGSRGTGVDILQKQINRILGASYTEAAGPVDGMFGILTKTGVERLQTALNSIVKPVPLLRIDGIVGPLTRAAMNDSCGGM